MSTRFEDPFAPLVTKETSSSARQNLELSSIFEGMNLLDDDVNRLEVVLGIAADANEVDWQSTNYIAPGMSFQEAMEALDGGGVSSNVLNQTRPTASGTISTTDDTKTFTVDAGTDVITATSHGLTTAQPFRIKNSGGSVPGGLSASTTYYAGSITTSTLKAYTSASNANTGTSPVDITTTGSGTHSFNGAVIFGSGTAFDTDLDSSSYVQLDSLTLKTYGVSSVDSATQVTLSSPVTQTTTAGTWKRLNNIRDVAVFTALPELQSDATLDQQPVRLSQLSSELAETQLLMTLSAPPVFTSTSSVTFARHARPSSDGTVLISVPTSQAVSLGSTGLNALDTGTKANSTWYYLYMVSKDDGVAPGYLWSTVNEKVSGAITLPTDYTKKCQTPYCWRTDASGNITDGIWSGKKYTYDAKLAAMDNTVGPTNVLDGGTSTSFVDVSLTAWVPPTSKFALIQFGFISDNLALRVNGASHDGTVYGSQGTGFYEHGRCDLKTDASQVIEYKKLSAGSVDLAVAGFEITEIP